MWCDTRLGRPRWVTGEPEGADLWAIPPVLMECVAFLCVQTGSGSFRYGATGFFVTVKSLAFPDVSYGYFVTAKHAVLEGQKHGALLVRVNLRAGGSDFIQSPGPWIYSDADIAVIEAVPPDDFRYRGLDLDTLITPEDLLRCGVGPGDEVFLCGLFDRKAGTTTNEPVIRVGHIAAMPSEPIPVEGVGAYPGYLIETRSTGGMSGAPVFVAYMPYRKCGPGTKVIGVFMSYWDITRWGRSLEFTKEDLIRISSGLGAVTPIEEVRKILLGDALMAKRKKDDERLKKERATTPASAFGDMEEEMTKEAFEQTLRRASKKHVVPPDSEKKGT